MSGLAENRGGAPVGLMSDLSRIEAASVLYLRLWSNGAGNRDAVLRGMGHGLSAAQGQSIAERFAALLGLCTRYARRPLQRHAVTCKCIGADEACFANFICAAAEGAREDAMLIATLLVRPDVAPMMTELASDLGLALKRLPLAPHSGGARRHPNPQSLN